MTRIANDGFAIFKLNFSKCAKRDLAPSKQESNRFNSELFSGAFIFRSFIFVFFYITRLLKGKAAPKEIEHRFRIKFPGMQCNIIQSHEELHSAVEKEIQDTLTTVQGCHACQLKDVATPGCESTASKRKRKAVDYAMEVLFSVLVKGGTDSSSPGDDVEEMSEAVLFQMRYAVATGQFQIALNGMNSTADRSSLRHLFSSITCAAGFVTSEDRKGCGKHCFF